MIPILVAAALLVQGGSIEGRVVVSGGDTSIPGAEVRLDGQARRAEYHGGRGRTV